MQLAGVYAICKGNALACLYAISKGYAIGAIGDDMHRRACMHWRSCMQLASVGYKIGERVCNLRGLCNLRASLQLASVHAICDRACNASVYVCNCRRACNFIERVCN